MGGRCLIGRIFQQKVGVESAPRIPLGEVPGSTEPIRYRGIGLQPQGFVHLQQAPPVGQIVSGCPQVAGTLEDPPLGLRHAQAGLVRAQQGEGSRYLRCGHRGTTHRGVPGARIIGVDGYARRHYVQPASPVGEGSAPVQIVRRAHRDGPVAGSRIGKCRACVVPGRRHHNSALAAGVIHRLLQRLRARCPT